MGLACSLKSQCGPGEVCSDWNVCAAPSHPYNLRLLYEGLRVLEPGWSARLDAATDDLQVRAIELDLEDVAKHEVVAGAELVRRSKYFTAVLDEPQPPGGDAGQAPVPDESPEEALQAADHEVRVGIWDIERGTELAILRLEAAGRFVRLGSNAGDTKTGRAQQRQANNCAAATEVREALLAGRPGAASSPSPVMPEAPEPVAD